MIVVRVDGSQDAGRRLSLAGLLSPASSPRSLYLMKHNLIKGLFHCTDLTLSNNNKYLGIFFPEIKGLATEIS